MNLSGETEMSRRSKIRLAAFILLIVVSIFLFYIGKEHLVFLDNRDITIDGTIYKASGNLEILLPGHKPIRITKGDFDAVTVSGPVHTLHIKVLDGKKNIVREFDYRLKLRFENQYRIHLPTVISKTS